jgi:polyhydroxyalkanoate synthesis repressor PhaR
MAQQPRIIKKYPNRRLYDTETSSYITLADVKKLVLDQVEFKVEDAKSHEDLTRSILLQIILEEETAGAPMFSSDMLSQIIRFYGTAMQGLMGRYLEQSANAFMEMNQQLQSQTRNLFGGFPFPNFQGGARPTSDAKSPESPANDNKREGDEKK